MDDDCILFVFIFYFFIYLYIFYRHEKKLYYETCIKKMIEEIRYIANGNFNHKVSIVNHNYLEELAIGVNEIVEQLKSQLMKKDKRTSKKSTYYKCIT